MTNAQEGPSDVGEETPCPNEPAPQKRIKITEPRRPTLTYSEINNNNILPNWRRANTYIIQAINAPKTYKGALKSVNKDLGVSSINKELGNMHKLGFWNVVKRQGNFKLIGTTWVFKIKINSANNTKEYKVKLCMQDFSQTLGIDFHKTYSPMGRLNSLHTLIAYAPANNLQFHRINVRSVFLKAPLSEEAYLSIPQGLKLNQHKCFLKLKKAIYGLRHRWHGNNA
ncbi:hypothetical protein O181_013813 [Austropuccinia psidii MF-1]|uniref:Reverse transcriptase Ty1/copia-type domain-containing protein n=1 Tax=Austropuccinia psidii MF-1 TaxID=1389203 RepID=A0A9Q3GNH1_9BASI|nr:hypothetical protein [Austropuccinia psidii MF-1]